MGWQIRRRTQDESLVSCQIFATNGGRLVDQAATEDYHANAVMSHRHRMGFQLRRPTRIFRHMRNGLAPMKIRSVHVFNKTQQPPGQDLRSLIQLEALFMAQLSGVDQIEDAEAATQRALRVLEITGGILLVGIALVVKIWAFPDAPAELATTSLVLEALP